MYIWLINFFYLLKYLRLVIAHDIFEVLSINFSFELMPRLHIELFYFFVEVKCVKLMASFWHILGHCWFLITCWVLDYILHILNVLLTFDLVMIVQFCNIRIEASMGGERFSWRSKLWMRVWVLRNKSTWLINDCMLTLAILITNCAIQLFTHILLRFIRFFIYFWLLWKTETHVLRIEVERFT